MSAIFLDHSAIDVARYLLARAASDGDLVSNLKMQKLVYYAYAHTLAQDNARLFDERIQAWPNGPVVPSLYRALRQYGAAPIDAEQFLGITLGDDGTDNFGSYADELGGSFPQPVRETLDGVYEAYIGMSAFELVVRTHSEKPWQEARRGLTPTERCNVALADEHILEAFSPSALF